MDASSDSVPNASGTGSQSGKIPFFSSLNKVSHSAGVNACDRMTAICSSVKILEGYLGVL